MGIILSAGEGPASRAYRRRVWVVAVVGLAAVLMGVLAQFSQASAPAGLPAEPAVVGAAHDGVVRKAALTLPATPSRDAADPMALGRVDAPVLMVEYADFNCGYCIRFARETEADLLRKYVDTGVVRFEFRNFAIRGDGSIALARAAWAAGQQGRFWPFHDEVYQRGTTDPTAAARAAGVPDLARFAADMDGAAASAAVDRDAADAQNAGAEMTPTFVINGKKLVGALPKEQFYEEIDSAARLARSGARLPY